MKYAIGMTLVFASALSVQAAATVGSVICSTSGASTGEKPQSKIWYADGSYWCIVRGPNGVAFY